MTDEKPDWDQHDFKKYDFPLDDIPRLDCMDPLVDELIRKKVSAALFVLSFVNFHVFSGRSNIASISYRNLWC